MGNARLKTILHPHRLHVDTAWLASEIVSHLILNVSPRDKLWGSVYVVGNTIRRSGDDPQPSGPYNIFWFDRPEDKTLVMLKFL